VLQQIENYDTPLQMMYGLQEVTTVITRTIGQNSIISGNALPIIFF
jgi:hypothetical protein